MEVIRGVVGLLFLLGVGYFFSSNRQKISWRLVAGGMVLQLLLAVLLLKVELVRGLFEGVVAFFAMVIGASEESALFLFGDLAKPGSGYGFAFAVLPTIIFFSALSSLLYYWGVLQKVVVGFAWLMKRTMRLSGAESLAAAANVFIGQTEAPLVVKPYLERMSRSEIMCLMVGGMATIAGGVFGAYMMILGGESEAERLRFGMHLLTASIISAPAAIVIAKILLPETEKVDEELVIPREDVGDNFLDALTRGTSDGLRLAVNVGAMLLAFMALIYLGNSVLAEVGAWRLGDYASLNEQITNWSDGLFTELSLQAILGTLFAPVAWVIGVESGDILAIGQTLGEKTVLNEFIGYLSLNEMSTSATVSDRSVIIGTYALCGFANFASIGIQIGGIGVLAPQRRKLLSQFGIRALIGGTIAALMTATVAGILYGV